MGGESVGERLATMEAQLTALKDELNEKHRQNRSSIHDLRDTLQTLSDKFSLSLDGLAAKIHAFDVSQARQHGWAAGAAAVGGCVVGIVMHFVDKVK